MTVYGWEDETGDYLGQKYLVLNAHKALIQKLKKTSADVLIGVPVGEDAELAQDEPRGVVVSNADAEKISKMLGEFADYITHEGNPSYAPPGKARLFVIENPPGYKVSCPFCGHEQEYFIGINELVYPSSCERCGVKVVAEIIGEDLPMTLMDILGEKYEKKEHSDFTEYSSDSGKLRVVVVEEPEEPYEDISYLLFVQEG